MTLAVRAFVVTAAVVFAADSLFSWSRPKAETFPPPPWEPFSCGPAARKANPIEIRRYHRHEP